MQTLPVRVMFEPLTAQVPIEERFVLRADTNSVSVAASIGGFRMLSPLQRMLSRGIWYVLVSAFCSGVKVSVTLVLEQGALLES